MRDGLDDELMTSGDVIGHALAVMRQRPDADVMTFSGVIRPDGGSDSFQHVLTSDCGFKKDVKNIAYT